MPYYFSFPFNFSALYLYAVIRGSSAVFLMDLSEPLLVHDSYNSYMSIVQGKEVFFILLLSFRNLFLWEPIKNIQFGGHAGTKNVVNICKECKVKRLIYNSSAHVVFDGLHEIWNGNESLPYPYKV